MGLSNRSLGALCWLGGLLLWAGCDEEVTAPPATEPGAVIVAQSDAWQANDTMVDPFPEHFDDQPCGPGAVRVEGEFLEINTGICGYNVLTQPTPTPIPSGATLTSDIIHQRLFAPTAAEAHVAMTLGGDIVWDESIPLPTDLEVWSISWNAPSAYPAGTPWVLHLHNHGSNTWLFGPVEMVPASF